MPMEVMSTTRRTSRARSLRVAESIRRSWGPSDRQYDPHGVFYEAVSRRLQIGSVDGKSLLCYQAHKAHCLRLPRGCPDIDSRACSKLNCNSSRPIMARRTVSLSCIVRLVKQL